MLLGMKQRTWKIGISNRCIVGKLQKDIGDSQGVKMKVLNTLKKSTSGHDGKNVSLMSSARASVVAP